LDAGIYEECLEVEPFPCQETKLAFEENDFRIFFYLADCRSQIIYLVEMAGKRRLSSG
jgi:hypothetical protein